MTPEGRMDPRPPEIQVLHHVKLLWTQWRRSLPREAFSHSEGLKFVRMLDDYEAELGLMPQLVSPVPSPSTDARAKLEQAHARWRAAKLAAMAAAEALEAMPLDEDADIFDAAVRVRDETAAKVPAAEAALLADTRAATEESEGRRKNGDLCAEVGHAGAGTGKCIHCGVSLRQSASAPTRETGWQPIETAPKDGTPVLVTGNNLTPTVSRCAMDGRWIAQMDMAWGSPLSRPTHWMPLPTPPRDERPQRGEREG